VLWTARRPASDSPSRRSPALRVAIDGRYIDDAFPGIGRYTAELVHALAALENGDELAVLCDPRLPSRRPAVASLRGVHLVPAPTPRSFALPQRRIRDLVRGIAPALFHSPWFLKPARLPCPSVVTIFDLIPRDHPRPDEGALRRLAFRVLTWRSWRTAAAVMVPSAFTRAELVRRLGVAPDRVHLTPLGVDRVRFRPREQAEIDAVRARHRLPERYVLTLGSNEPHKNLTRLLDAWNRLAAHEGARLVVAGHENPRYRATRALIDARDLARDVAVLGDVDDDELPALLSGATMLVHPSLAEGFGLTVLEAMACGTPVVCSHAGALPELVGDAAVVVAPTDAEGIGDAVRRVLRDTGLREELRTRGLARSADFSWRTTAETTRAVYRRVAAARA